MITHLALAIMRWYVQIFGEDRTLLAVAMAMPTVTAGEVRDLFEVVE